MPSGARLDCTQLRSRLPRPASHTPGNAAAAPTRAIRPAELRTAGKAAGRRRNEGAGGEPGLRAKRPGAAD